MSLMHVSLDVQELNVVTTRAKLILREIVKLCEISTTFPQLKRRLQPVKLDKDQDFSICDRYTAVPM